MATSSKIIFINAIIFMVLTAVSLGFMFRQPIRIEYFEIDNKPGFTEGDTYVLNQNLEAVVQRRPHIEAIIKEPNYFAGLVSVVIISCVGGAFSIAQWEKHRHDV